MSTTCKRKICYILSYRQPNYVRTTSLLQALRQLDNVTLFTAINQRTGFIRYFDTLWQLITIRWRHNPDYYLLGFRGHEIFWLVKLITLGKPLIFDSLLSPTASLLEENKFGKLGVIGGKFLFFLERIMLHQADHLLTDTQLHANFLCTYFQLPSQKISPLPVGADETWQASPPRQSRTTPLEILFYGSFLPLHGMSIMLEAAARLKDKPIHFTFIGGTGKNLREFNKLKTNLGLHEQVTHLNWVTFDTLHKHYLANADLGLGGPFGNTPQARRVVTGKTSQFLAMAKPTIIGAIAEPIGFLDKQNCLLVPQGNIEALVQAIEWAYLHPEELKRIGQAGLQLYQTTLSITQIAQRLTTVLDAC
jgi:glycosyltransferase involved in cell wall biosynthesis